MERQIAPSGYSAFISLYLRRIEYLKNCRVENKESLIDEQRQLILHAVDDFICDSTDNVFVQEQDEHDLCPMEKPVNTWKDVRYKFQYVPSYEELIANPELVKSWKEKEEPEQ